MREIVNSLVTFQIGVFASSPATATVAVTVLDCLIVYAGILAARKKVSQGELSAVSFAIVLIVLVVLEFTR